jgi:hypothetical protein
MSAHLAQVCLFKKDGAQLKRFCEVLSGEVELANGALTSFVMGASSVAHHPPAGELGEGDVLVTLQLASAAEVDRIHAALRAARLELDDAPEDTDWGWRLFYFRAAPHLVFEVGAPLS